MTDAPALSVRDLSIGVGPHNVVDGVTLDIGRGEIVALVGESGSGKSLTALAIMGLLDGAVRRTSGTAALDGTDMPLDDDAAMRRLRGTSMSMIFQEPVASLNPLLSVGAQVAESLVVHGRAKPAEARDRAVEMLREVGLPAPERRAKQLPSELSGGMCQRVSIASALISSPRLLIADEPTTALDVTIQAQILRLVRRLRDDTGTSVLLITHDMGVVASVADRVSVMYGGRIVETAPVDDLFAGPRHPYTKLLLATVPRLTGPRKTELFSIGGAVPDISDWPRGCRFRTRCPLASDYCTDRPPLSPRGSPDHLAACWHSDRVEDLA